MDTDRKGFVNEGFVKREIKPRYARIIDALKSIYSDLADGHIDLHNANVYLSVLHSAASCLVFAIFVLFMMPIFIILTTSSCLLSLICIMFRKNKFLMYYFKRNRPAGARFISIQSAKFVSVNKVTDRFVNIQDASDPKSENILILMKITDSIYILTDGNRYVEVSLNKGKGEAEISASAIDAPTIFSVRDAIDRVMSGRLLDDDGS